ncbi:TetR family transcriptional regulator [Microbacteriaceae bacterium VKM Ac-2855]|nr:TetR family transcriptional regulator [Microbacteriaceae bacterium VKM Ac-2855]
MTLASRHSDSRPSGRLSQSEARDRLISAAFGTLGRDGIHLSVNLLGYEELIRASGVPRSTAYRLWGSKEEFFEAVLAAIPSMSAAQRDQSGSLAIAARSIEAMQSELATPAGRRAILLETIRAAVSHHSETVTTTQEWRNWIALSVALGTLTDSVREQVTAELREQENDRIDAMAAFYRRVATVLGLRLKPEFGDDFRILSIGTGAFLEGLGIVRGVVPDDATRRFVVDDSEWSLAAIGFSALFDRFVEPDPEWRGFAR